MDNTNKYMVGVRGKEIVIMLPPMGSISKHDALMMAAWIVTLADDDDKFAEYIAAVQS